MKNEFPLTEKQRKELVLNILTDAIIFERTATAINMLQRVANPKEEDWGPEYQYNGFSNTYNLMGVPAYESFENEQKYLPIVDILRKIFDNGLAFDDRRPEQNKLTAGEIAKEIFEEWEGFLNNTDLGFKKAS